MIKGTEIGLRIDQTLTQDATGTMAYLQFEAMGIDRVKTERSLAYIDHNTLQSGFENADDHRYIGGLDVAVAMGGGAYYITMPKVVKVNLTGKLNDWVSAKDVILKVLQIMSVKGGVGKVIEYCGEGVKSLSVPERATITNY